MLNRVGQTGVYQIMQESTTSDPASTQTINPLWSNAIIKQTGHYDYDCLLACNKANVKKKILRDNCIQSLNIKHKI